MRFSIIALFLLSTSVCAQDPLPIPKPKSTTTLAVKAGEIIVVSPAAKSVDFSWDKVMFPVAEKRAVVDGNKLYLTTTFNGRYVVVVADYEAKTQTEWIINVTGGTEPPIIPPVVTPPVETDVATSLKALAKAVQDLQTRVAALEVAKPPPVNAVAKHITFIGSEMNSAALAVNNDASLRKWFADSGVVGHWMKYVPADVAAKGMTKAVEKAGGAPCVVIQDDLGNVIGQGPMQSSAAVKDLAAQFIRR